MPHPLRMKAQGKMVYTIPLIIFMDDVSGNITKQWNKHHVIYMSNANLPREMLEKEFHVRFVTSSPYASPMELMAAMRDSIRYATCIFVHLSDLHFFIVKQQKPVYLLMIVNTTRRSFSFLMDFSGPVITPCKQRSVVLAD
jgi:hypothetical protein